MGFSITACIFAVVMFICYCAGLAEFAKHIQCRNSVPVYNSLSGSYQINTYCYTDYIRQKAKVGAGLGSCQLIFAIVEFFVALSSSIYCCNAGCCGAPSVGTVSVEACIFS